MHIFSALIESLGTAVAIPLLEELGGWPVLGSATGGNWDAHAFDLVDTMIILRKYNNRPFIDLHSAADMKNSSAHIIYVRCLNRSLQ